MDFQGKVIQFLGETSGTSKAGKPWKKKEWLVEVSSGGQYTRNVKVQCFGDRADAMHLENGHTYTLFVDLESREFNGRWYTDVSVYRYEETQGQPQFGQTQTQTPQQPGGFSSDMPYQPASPSFGGIETNDSDEDLPF